jgi:hypothetical protein
VIQIDNVLKPVNLIEEIGRGLEPSFFIGIASPTEFNPKHINPD